MAKRGVAKQGANRGEPSVAGAHTVSPLLLEMVQKSTDERRIEVAEIQLRGRDASPRRREAQQEPQRVSVGSDRVRTHLALPDEAVGEERL